MKECVGLFHQFCCSSGLSEYRPSTWDEYRRWVARSLAFYRESWTSTWDNAIANLWSEYHGGDIPTWVDTDCICTDDDLDRDDDRDQDEYPECHGYIASRGAAEFAYERWYARHAA